MTSERYHDYAGAVSVASGAELMQPSPNLSPMIGIRGSEGEAVWWRQVKGPCLPAALSHPLHVLNLIKTMLTWPLNSPLLIYIGKSFCIIWFSKQTIFSCISKIRIMPLLPFIPIKLVWILSLTNMAAIFTTLYIVQCHWQYWWYAMTPIHTLKEEWMFWQDVILPFLCSLSYEMKVVSVYVFWMCMSSNHQVCLLNIVVCERQWEDKTVKKRY
jgi:hypothetical protein